MRDRRARWRRRRRWAASLAALGAVLGPAGGALAARHHRRGHRPDDLIGWQGERARAGGGAGAGAGGGSAVDEAADPEAADLGADGARGQLPYGLLGHLAWEQGNQGLLLGDALLDARGEAETKAKAAKMEARPEVFHKAGVLAGLGAVRRPDRSVRVFPPAGPLREPTLPKYAHMATLARSPFNASLAVAFQATEEVEGEDGQRIWYAFSKTAHGDAWWPPVPVPLLQVSLKLPPPESVFLPGAQWGPVLFEDRARALLWLVYSESGADCHDPPTQQSPGRWAVGGSIMAATFDGRRWGNPKVLYDFAEGHVPKVTANSMIETADGTWVLPFWRQKARHIFGKAPNGRLVRRCFDRAKPQTISAGVLISEDRGASWTARGMLREKAAGWLIENAVVETAPRKLLMYFRTKAGFVYASTSPDNGYTWGPARRVDALTNPDTKVHLTKLPDGTLVLAHNDHPRPFAAVEGHPAEQTRERHRLLVSVSTDGGETWQRQVRVDTDPVPERPRAAPKNLKETLFGRDEGAVSELPDAAFVTKLRDEPAGKLVFAEGGYVKAQAGLADQAHYPFLQRVAAPKGLEAATPFLHPFAVGYTKSVLDLQTGLAHGHEIWVSTFTINTQQGVDTSDRGDRQEAATEEVGAEEEGEAEAEGSADG